MKVNGLEPEKGESNTGENTVTIALITYSKVLHAALYLTLIRKGNPWNKHLQPPHQKWKSNFYTNFPMTNM